MTGETVYGTHCHGDGFTPNLRSVYKYLLGRKFPKRNTLQPFKRLQNSEGEVNKKKIYLLQSFILRTDLLSQFYNTHKKNPIDKDPSEFLTGFNDY